MKRVFELGLIAPQGAGKDHMVRQFEQAGACVHLVRLASPLKYLTGILLNQLEQWGESVPAEEYEALETRKPELKKIELALFPHELKNASQKIVSELRNMIKPLNLSLPEEPIEKLIETFSSFKKGTKYVFTIREFQQWLGTNFVRKYLGEDIWANLAALKMKSIRESDLEDNQVHFIICPDIRFENEANIILNLTDVGSFIMYIHRASKDNLREEWKINDSVHPSEHFCFFLRNWYRANPKCRVVLHEGLPIAYYNKDNDEENPFLTYTRFLELKQVADKYC